jgi:uncharacterized protein (UPF0332 family)
LNKKMAFNWQEYLELAKELAGLQRSEYSRECAYRSAVSRAYYSAFCWCRNYAEKHSGFKPTGEAKDHKYLREYLRKLGKDWGKIASKLDKLRRWRNKCDYDNDLNNIDLEGMVYQSIEISQEIIEKCKL